MKLTDLLGLLAACCLSVAPAAAQMLPEGQDWREIPFEVADGKPMLAVAVNGAKGRMMLDTGTPEALFVNRDAAAGLDAGLFVTTGTAASGQAIAVRLHDAPQVEIAGLPFTTAAKVPSGDFGFAEGAFGSDFLGFIGAPMVDHGAFLLDYGRSVVTLLRTEAGGALAVPPPAPEDVAAHLTFVMAKGQQPTTAAFLGDLPIGLDFDTGDGGTIYLRPETRARLEAEGLLRPAGDSAVLTRVSFGGTQFTDLAVRVVEAGGPQDMRPWPGSDFLRLGAQFLSTRPSLWNFPAGTLTILRPEAAFLARR